MLTEKIIKTEKYTKVYKKADRDHGHDHSRDRQLFACRDVDFEAHEGSVTGLLGPNGAGKSTLIKALCGIIYPTSGKVCVYGDIALLKIRQKTGYVSETPDLDENLTVKEILYESSLCHGISRDRCQDLVKKASRICQVEDVLDKKVSALSKGYRQRTSFARELAFDPQILILDEFTGGLDPAQIISMRKAVKSLSKHKTIVLSTHNIEEAVSLCDNLYIMNKGKVVISGDIATILAKTGKKTLENAYLALTEENRHE